MVQAENSLTHKELHETLLNVVIESWRFSRIFERLLGKIADGAQQRYHNQLLWFTKKLNEALEQSKLKIVNLEGQPYDPGMAATPLNLDEFSEEDNLVIDQMVEPIVMGPEGIIKMGTVMLRSVEQ